MSNSCSTPTPTPTPNNGGGGDGGGGGPYDDPNDPIDNDQICEWQEVTEEITASIEGGCADEVDAYSGLPTGQQTCWDGQPADTITYWTYVCVDAPQNP